MSNGSWAIVELFGHAKVAGWVEKDERFGPPLVRVDVPELPAIDGAASVEAHSSFYGNGAIYALHPVGERLALMEAARIRHRPVVIYDPEMVERAEYDRLREKMAGRLIDAPTEDVEEFDEDDGDDD